MEVLGQTQTFSGTVFLSRSGNRRIGPSSARPKGVSVGWGVGSFSDDGHLKYYASPARCGGKGKEEKKRVKAVEKLSKNLSALVGMDKGEGWQAGGIGTEQRVLEAAGALLVQLEQLRHDEKNELMNKKKKEEKNMAKKQCCNEGNMSSSSSSESSESESEEDCVNIRSEKSGSIIDVASGSLVSLNNLDSVNCGCANNNGAADVIEVENGSVDDKKMEMNNNKKKEKGRKKMTVSMKEQMSSSSESSESECEQVVDMSCVDTLAIPVSPPRQHQKWTVLDHMSDPSEEVYNYFKSLAQSPSSGDTGCEHGLLGAFANKISQKSESLSECEETATHNILKDAIEMMSQIDIENKKLRDMTVRTTMPTNKIEVCMGGKCKKSGSLQLMEEFKNQVGSDGTVVGCKCMGKCKEGPNIRVSTCHKEGEDSVAPPRSSLCIGVGFQDIGAIVYNYFGKKGTGPLPA